MLIARNWDPNLMMNNQSRGTWCLVSIANKEVRARIAHVGRGKFKILEEESGKFFDAKIDASDVFHCRE